MSLRLVLSPRAPCEATRGFLLSLRALVQLAKPRILLMLLLTSALGAFLYDRVVFTNSHFWLSASGLTMVAAGADAWNQIVERESDRRMARTAERPVASGALTAHSAGVLATLWVSTGLTLLGLYGSVLSAELSLLSFALYVCAYTPLKRHSGLCVLIGAIPGAMPPVIMIAALSGRILPVSLYLFSVLFVWQFPHVYSIAWLYQDDYRRVGIVMSPTSGSTRNALGWWVALGTAMLSAVGGVGVCFVRHGHGRAFVLLLLAAVLPMAVTSWGLIRYRDSRWARRALWTSLGFIPSWAAVLVGSFR